MTLHHMNLLQFGGLRLQLEKSGTGYITLNIGHSGGKGAYK